jgi:hypothetical protein
MFWDLQGDIRSTEISYNSNAYAYRSSHYIHLFIGNVNEYISHKLVEYHVCVILAFNRRIGVAKLGSHNMLGRNNW